MRAVVQRVTRASVKVDEEIIGEIGNGLVVLLGIARDDTKVEAAYLVDKIANLRIFDDDEGKMYLSVKDRSRGLRPSWIDAAPPEVAGPLYDFFVRQARATIDNVATGKFQAMMLVELINDGPVTI